VGGELQVPAAGEELVAGAGDDGTAQGLVVLVGDERLAEGLAGGTVEGVGLGSVDGELEDGAVALGLDRAGHGVSVRLAARDLVGSWHSWQALLTYGVLFMRSMP